MLQGDPTSLEHIPRKLGQSKQNWFVIYFHLRSQLLKKLFLIAKRNFYEAQTRWRTLYYMCLRHIRCISARACAGLFFLKGISPHIQ